MPLEEFFCRFGVPLKINSDQGQNFESSILWEVCKPLQIKHALHLCILS